MLEILNWLCLISICFLTSQVFLYMCKNALDIFNDIKLQKKKSLRKSAVPSVTDMLINKIAK